MIDGVITVALDATSRDDDDDDTFERRYRRSGIAAHRPPQVSMRPDKEVLRCRVRSAQRRSRGRSGGHDTLAWRLIFGAGRGLACEYPVKSIWRLNSMIGHFAYECTGQSRDHH